MTHCYMDFMYFSFIPDTNSFWAQCRPQIQKQEVSCFEHSGLGGVCMFSLCLHVFSPGTQVQRHAH